VIAWKRFVKNDRHTRKETLGIQYAWKRREIKTSVRKFDNLGDLNIDAKIILRWVLRKWGVDWIQLAQDRAEWWALMDTVINHMFRKRQGFLC
jgi:hypothetical protein